MTHAKRQTAKTTVVPLVGAELRVLNALLLLTGIVLGAAYVVLAVGTNSKVVEVRGVKAEIATLREEQQRLEIDMTAGRSMDAIEGKVGELGLVPIERIDYVDVPGGVVAVR